MKHENARIHKNIKLEDIVKTSAEFLPEITPAEFKNCCRRWGELRELKGTERNLAICEKLDCSLGQLYKFWEGRQNPSTTQLFALSFMFQQEGTSIVIFRYKGGNDRLSKDRKMTVKRMAAAALMCDLDPIIVDWDEQRYRKWIRTAADTHEKRKAFSKILAEEALNFQK